MRLASRSVPWLGAIAMAWLLLVTVLFWGSELREVWRARGEKEYVVFIVAHPSTWALYLALLILPLMLLVRAWRRSRAV